MRSHPPPPSPHRPGTLLEDHDDQQALEKNTGSQMLKNCKIKLSLWHKKISFEVKKSEINVLQNARNAVSARQPNFPPRYLFLRPCLVRRLVGSHPPVKKKKKTGYGPVHQEPMILILPMTGPRVPGCRHD